MPEQVKPPSQVRVEAFRMHYATQNNGGTCPEGCHICQKRRWEARYGEGVLGSYDYIQIG